PIVAMTANALVEDRDKCMAAGMDGYLAKPVKDEELRSVLDHLLFGVETSPAQAGGAGPAPAEGDGALDPEQFALLRALGEPAVVATLVEQYLQDAATQLDDLRRIAEGGDPGDLRIAAHGLRGSSATMGASAVAATCEALEHAAGQGRMPAPDVLERLSFELDRAAEAMRSQLT
ncbi:MAG TPA: Hpt domain-containing protein, partial [Acidimicrobiales bacterium]|nr:Hpt domain-containing protein [Acidimicrobiales bacterium]